MNLMANNSGPDPFSTIRRLQSDMNQIFGGSTQTATGGFPAVNIYQNEDALLLTAELPGLNDKDIELTVQDDCITIAANIPVDEVENAIWHRNERRRGKFSRTVELPFRVDSEEVIARFKNGVLEVEVNRPEHEKPRRIAINN